MQSLEQAAYTGEHGRREHVVGVVRAVGRDGFVGQRVLEAVAGGEDVGERRAHVRAQRRVVGNG